MNILSKTTRLLIKFFVVALLVIIISLFAVYQLADPNYFKPQIQKIVQDATGRNLTIAGDFSLSFFPHLAIKTGELSLSNAANFASTPFATVDQGNIAIKTIPLLSMQVEVDKLTLKGLQLNLAIDKQGNSNWQDLLADKPQIQSSGTKSLPTKSTPQLFNIDGISIEQASITWDDKLRGKYITIDDLNFVANGLAEQMAIELSFAIAEESSSIAGKINATSDLTIGKNWQKLQLQNTDIKAIVAKKNYQQIKSNLLANITADFLHKSIAIDALEFNSDYFVLTGDINASTANATPELAGNISINDLNIAKILNYFGKPLQKNNNPPPYQASLHASLATTNDTLNIALNAKLDETTLQGTVGIRDFIKPQIAINLNIDQFNFNHYQLAKTKQQAIAKSPVAVTAATTLLPTKQLQKLHLQASLAIGELQFKKLNMRTITITIAAKDGVIRHQHAVGNILAGTMTIDVNGKQPTFALSETATAIAIEPLLATTFGSSKLIGTADIDTKLYAQGNSVQQLKASLGGNFDFAIRDGALKGFNAQNIIDKYKKLIGKSVGHSRANQTPFSIAEGNITIVNGVLNNRDLLIETSKLRITGSGDIDLANELIDYTSKSYIYRKSRNQDNSKKVRSIPIIITIGGSFSDTTYKIQPIAMLRTKYQDKLLKKYESKLNEKSIEWVEKVKPELKGNLGKLLQGILKKIE